MSKKFAEHTGLNLVRTNKDVLEAWKKNDIFHKSIDERNGAPQFIFFEGPPSANESKTNYTLCWNKKDLHDQQLLCGRSTI